MSRSLHRAIVGMDLGAEPEPVLRWANRLVKGGEAVLAYVVEIPRKPDFMHPELPGHAEIVAAASAEAASTLQALAASCDTLSSTIEVREGRPAEELVALADEVEADVLVVGSRRRRSGLGHFLGSTTEELVRTSPIPVVVVATSSPEVSGRILVCLDDSELGPTVLAWGSRLAGLLDAEATVLHCVPPGVYGPIRLVSSAGASTRLRDVAVGSAAAWLEDKVRKHGLPADSTESVAVAGDPAHEIVKSAAEIAADLVVMGGRGSRGAGTFLLGSVARLVLANPPCPIFVVTDTDF